MKAIYSCGCSIEVRVHQVVPSVCEQCRAKGGFSHTSTDAKPDAPEWDGVGKPPVGLTNRQFVLMTRISCACNDHEDTYYEVVAHFNDFVVVAGRSGVSGEVFAHAVSPGSCRPIKTQSEREREETVAVAMELTCGKDDGRETIQRSVIRQCLEELHDAGMLRKREVE